MARGDRERWDARHRAGHCAGPPAEAVLDLVRWLPTRGRALDVAGGTGRHALWLAARGLDVTLVDVSPVALDRAQHAARRLGLPLRVLEADLDVEPLPEGPWALILVCNYLNRPLVQDAVHALAPGGVLCVVHPTVRNLERHARPPRRYVLAEGELRVLTRGLECLHYDEGWHPSGEGAPRHLARLVARRPSTDAEAEAGPARG